MGRLRTLAELKAGERGRVARVDEHVPGLLAYLQGLGIVPGAGISLRDLAYAKSESWG